MNLRIPIVATALALMGGTPLLAQAGFGDATITRAQGEAHAEQRFASLDANHDGSLSTDELAAMGPGAPGSVTDTNSDHKFGKDEFVAAMLKNFDRMDTDHDGQLTKAERNAGRRQQ